MTSVTQRRLDLLVSGPRSCPVVAKCMSNLLRIGNTKYREKNGRTFELRSKLRIGERGTSADATCSSLNFSAHAITGRQMIWSITTITPIMVARPQQIALVLAAFAAV